MSLWLLMGTFADRGDNTSILSSERPMICAGCQGVEPSKSTVEGAVDMRKGRVD
jgi:hypothetical protein